MVRVYHILLFINILTLSEVTIATPPSSRILNAACSLYVVGEPESGDNFEVIFEFTPMQEIWHTKLIRDLAWISTGGNVQYISGDTLWTGFLEKGQTYKIRSVYQLSGRYCAILFGTVMAVEAYSTRKDKFIPYIGKRTGIGKSIILGDGYPLGIQKRVDTNYIPIEKIIECREKQIYFQKKHINIIIKYGSLGKISFPCQPGLRFEYIDPIRVKLINEGNTDSLRFELNTRSYVFPIVIDRVNTFNKR